MKNKDILELKNPLLLFGDCVDPKAKWKRLILEYHPDRNAGRESECQEICTHIGKLWDQFQSIASKVETTDLQQVLPFELGALYIYKEKLVYVFESEKHLAKKCKFEYRYPDNAMKDNYEHIVYNTQVENDTVTFNRYPNTIPLSSVLKVYGKLDPRHVAWVISRFTNLVCLFEYNQFSHNALTLNNCFVDLENHSIYPYGWWFKEDIGSPLSTVSGDIYPFIPESVKLEKKATSAIDMIAVREIGKLLLGNGMMLSRSKEVPKPMLNWLFSPPAETAVKDFLQWRTAMDKSFGSRRFVKFDPDYKKLYNL